MKKLILAVMLACASVSAHANTFGVQLGQFDTQAQAQAYVMALVKAGIPAFAETKDGKVLLRAGPFATKDQAQAALSKITSAHLLENISVPIVRAAAPASAPTRAGDTVAIAKQMDSEWQIYSPARHECETLTVFFGRITGRDMGIRTPEQFAAYYGNGVTVHYGHGGEAAEVDDGDVKYMLAHGTDACNEMEKAIQGDGY